MNLQYPTTTKQAPFFERVKMAWDRVATAFNPPKPKVDHVQWTGDQLVKALHRNGIIIGRAKRRERPLNSLTGPEMELMDSVRGVARMMGYSEVTIRNFEWEGQMDKTLIEEPVFVKLKFYCWNNADIDHPEPTPSYKVLDSNHPMFLDGHIYEKHSLELCGINLPRTPKYETWNGKIL